MTNSFRITRQCMGTILQHAAGLTGVLGSKSHTGSGCWSWILISHFWYRFVLNEIEACENQVTMADLWCTEQFFNVLCVWLQYIEQVMFNYFIRCCSYFASHMVNLHTTKHTFMKSSETRQPFMKHYQYFSCFSSTYWLPETHKFFNWEFSAQSALSASRLYLSHTYFYYHQILGEQSSNSKENTNSITKYCCLVRTTGCLAFLLLGLNTLILVQEASKSMTSPSHTEQSCWQRWISKSWVNLQWSRKWGANYIMSPMVSAWDDQVQCVNVQLMCTVMQCMHAQIWLQCGWHIIGWSNAGWYDAGQACICSHHNLTVTPIILTLRKYQFPSILGLSVQPWQRPCNNGQCTMISNMNRWLPDLCST